MKMNKQYLLILFNENITVGDTPEIIFENNIDEIAVYDSPDKAMKDIYLVAPDEDYDKYVLLEISKVNLFKHPKSSKRTWVDINE